MRAIFILREGVYNAVFVCVFIAYEFSVKRHIAVHGAGKNFRAGAIGIPYTVEQRVTRVHVDRRAVAHKYGVVVVHNLRRAVAEHVYKLQMHNLVSRLNGIYFYILFAGLLVSFDIAVVKNYALGQIV